MARTKSAQITNCNEQRKSEVFAGVRVIIIDDNWFSEPSMELLMNLEMCQRIRQDGNRIATQIKDLLKEIDNFNPQHSLHDFMMLFRHKLHRYSVMKCDCRWQEYDEDLKRAIDLLEDCYQDLLPKKCFTVRDFRNMINVLETTMYVFEHKVEQLEEYLNA